MKKQKQMQKNKKNKKNKKDDKKSFLEQLMYLRNKNIVDTYCTYGPDRLENSVEITKK
ncbi:MAG: hypothetical protein ACOCUV_00590 [bacterium]